MWSALCPCGASVRTSGCTTLFLCGRRLGYAHHAGSPGAGRVFDVFPQFWYRSWKRQSCFRLPRDLLDSSRVGKHGLVSVNTSLGVVRHSSGVGGHSPRVGDTASRVGGHSSGVGGHSPRVRGHSSRVGGHSFRVGKHSSRGREHSSRVRGHSSGVGGHSPRVRRTQLSCRCNPPSCRWT